MQRDNNVKTVNNADVFYSNIEHFDTLYHRGILSLPLSTFDFGEPENAIDKASETIRASFHNAFIGLGRVIAQHE